MEMISSLRKQSKPNKIIVVRPDRLGDVILSTPVFEALKRHYPESNLKVLVQENVVPVLNGLSSINGFLVFDPNGKHSGFKGFFRLYSEIRKERFDIAVVLNSH